VRKKL